MLTRSVLAPLLIAAALLGTSPTPAAAVPGPPPLHQGWIVTEPARDRCLTGGPVGTVLFTATCDRANKGQDFYQTSDGHFTQGGNCVQPGHVSAKARVAACTYKAGQHWWFTTTLQAGDRSGRCLTEVSVDSAGVGTVRLRDCTGKPDQQWRSVNPW